MNLVIVESPSKAKTIKKFLGKNYDVKASMGHIIDLPKSQLGVDLESLEVKYITIRGKGKILQELKKAGKKADKIFLATDPDREGEAISWHLANSFGIDTTERCRVVFNEITPKAIKEGFKNPRNIDQALVDAQQARRILDRIVGYKISPLLWRKVKKGLSAGRVQSVAVRLIVDREREIRDFIPKEYWTLQVELQNAQQEILQPKLVSYKDDKIEINTKEEMDRIVSVIEKGQFLVDKVKETERQKHPSPPFTTSNLQQEAARKLNFSPKKTMMIAQQLYEGIKLGKRGSVGLITYIRTDSTRLSDEFIRNLRNYIVNNYGEKYISKEIRKYKSKKNAQEAHEAIRPTDLNNNPDEIKEFLTNDQYKLYKLIWLRTIASQMASAVYNVLTIDIKNSDYTFRQTGSILKFSGFTEVYLEGQDEIEDEELVFKGIVKEGEILNLLKVDPKQHFTQPPPRFTEAMLVKTLEEKGIGRPSTYAPIIDTISNRGYVIKDKKVFVPTELGEIVTDLMLEHFPKIVDISFTAQMEDKLDKIEEGKESWEDLIKAFYEDFQKDLQKAEAQIPQVELEDEISDVVCEKCGRNMVYKLGKFGRFLACPGFPECRNTKTLVEELGIVCPICKQGKVVIRKTKKGRQFFGCSRYPECEFQSWDKPIGEICPKCGSYLVEKGRGNNKKFVCSSEKCGFVKDRS
ncbi:type I DNA topoisomerase [Anaerobranca gottschalkii]|uniref:DNA topoisomerase 1 n=1 Tax=Anaerobranca gottschalkii DSM 13577 TaxID=1120990 RepID=A0A1H9ZDR6_9FIRM|nr:type I DNA topoisomerase [Anaerobranca gottschalkii]SES79795.1 DNA topoisomerase-1 [Anaerobranca gottschalkii DSM 13577]